MYGGPGGHPMGGGSGGGGGSSSGGHGYPAYPPPPPASSSQHGGAPGSGWGPASSYGHGGNGATHAGSGLGGGPFEGSTDTIAGPYDHAPRRGSYGGGGNLHPASAAAQGLPPPPPVNPFYSQPGGEQSFASGFTHTETPGGYAALGGYEDDAKIPLNDEGLSSHGHYPPRSDYQ